LAVCETKKKKYRKSVEKFPEAVKVAGLFRKNGNLKLIRDGDFLIGEFYDGKARGKRIDVLPDGEKLDKGFSLFAPGLMLHDESSHGHWDVIFRNPNGSFCYIYSLKKVRDSKKKKFRLVDDFEKCLPRLKRNLLREISGERKIEGGKWNGDLVLAMLVLLKTRMRIGSEIYYKRSHHKGLTTLKKRDVKISGTRVTFSFIGKDGVPQVLNESFGVRIINELKRVLKKRKLDDFVFLNSKGKSFSDVEFEAGFERFCGERFYPHIVRSHFATREVERFLSKKKGDAKKFCLGLAGKLGHKKFSKKDGVWEDSYEVTLHHYVRPDLVERIKKLI
jgi:hypothetical protein